MDLPPNQRQPITWNKDGLLSIEHFETNFSEILVTIKTIYSPKFIYRYRLRSGNQSVEGVTS